MSLFHLACWYSYSGDGAFLPSSGQGTLYVARPLPTFTSDVINRSSQAYAVKAR